MARLLSSLFFAIIAAVVATFSLMGAAMIVAGIPVPGAPVLTLAASPRELALFDLGLWGVFGLQHSLMARKAFKRRLPPSIERSVYVAASGLALLILAMAWQRLPGEVWNLPLPLTSRVLWGLSIFGVLMALFAAASIDGLDLMGLRRPLLRRQGYEYRDPPFVTPLLYRWVRHPLQLGVLLAVWSTPQMSTNRFVFAAGATVYILVGIHLEERDLLESFGSRYEAYQKATPMLLPLRWLFRRSRSSDV